MPPLPSDTVLPMTVDEAKNGGELDVVKGDDNSAGNSDSLEKAEVLSDKEGTVTEGGETSKNRYNTVFNLHVAAFVFMGIQSIAYGAIDVDLTTLPTVGFPVYCNQQIPGNDCGGTWNSTPGLQKLPEQAPIWLMCFFVVLASFDHLVTAVYAHLYPESAKWWLYVAQSNPFRMIEYSISASAMVWGITQLCGIHDVHLIMMLCTGTALGMILGLCCELLPREDNPNDNIKISTIRNIIYCTAAASIFIPWLVIMCYFFQSAKRSPPPDFVYAAFLGTLLLFICFGINSYLNRIAKKYDFETAEIVYVCLSFTAKTFLAADVFGGLRAAADDD